MRNKIYDWIENQTNEIFLTSCCCSCGAMEKVMLAKKNMAETLSQLDVRPLLEMKRMTTRQEWRRWKSGSLMCSAKDAGACFTVALPMLLSQMQIGQGMAMLLWVMRFRILLVS